MDPLEQDLRRALADPRRTLLSAGDPLPGIAAGMRRRRRTRTAVAASSAVGVAVVAVLVGSAVLNGPARTGLQVANPPTVTTPAALTPTKGTSSAPTPSTPGVVAPPASRRPTATPSRSASASASIPAAAPVPAGFAAADLSFVSATRGWALGTAPCRTAPCTSLLRTTDGGRSWTGGPAPVAYLTSDGVDCSVNACVSHLRFADSTHGYAYGPRALFTTSDGGRTWARQRTAPYIDALEAAGADVLAVMPETDGCPPGCDYTISRQQVGSSTWTPVGLPAGGLHGDSTRLLRHGNDTYVLAYANPAGGAGDAHAQVVVSHDRGRTWTQRSDPCSAVAANDPAERDAADAAIGPDGSLAVLCLDRQGRQTGEETVSTDGGRSFGAVQPLPPTEVPQAIATSGSRLVVFATQGDANVLLTSTDGGASWASTVVAPQGRPGSAPAGGLLGFTDAQTASWAPPGSPSIWRSLDGGATWSPIPFRP